MKLLLWIIFAIFAFCVGLFFNTAHDLPLIVAVVMMVICGGLMGRGFAAYMEDF